MLKAELRVLDGKHQGKSIPLTVKKFLVGREQDCQLRPNSDLVSRHHCVFTIDDFAVRLRDLGSTNGTYVNGQRMTGVVVLQPGDQISIGKLTLELAILAEHEATPEAVPAADPSVSDDTLHGGSETQDAFVLPEINSGDTAMIDVGDIPAENQAVLVPAGQETVQGGVMLGYFPQGYPQMMPGMVPGMPQMAGYPQMPGYPQFPGGQVPGMMPGMMPPGMGTVPMGAYPQMPYPQMMMPGMMPGMMPAGMGTVQMPAVAAQAAPPVAPPSAGGGGDKVSKIAAPPMTLPPPEETGAREPAPKPVAPPAADGSKGAPPVNPSSAAADIIRQHMQKRR